MYIYIYVCVFLLWGGWIIYIYMFFICDLAQAHLIDTEKNTSDFENNILPDFSASFFRWPEMGSEYVPDYFERLPGYLTACVAMASKSFDRPGNVRLFWDACVDRDISHQEWNDHLYRIGKLGLDSDLFLEASGMTNLWRYRAALTCVATYMTADRENESGDKEHMAVLGKTILALMKSKEDMPVVEDGPRFPVSKRPIPVDDTPKGVPELQNMKFKKNDSATSPKIWVGVMAAREIHRRAIHKTNEFAQTQRSRNIWDRSTVVAKSHAEISTSVLSVSSKPIDSMIERSAVLNAPARAQSKAIAWGSVNLSMKFCRQGLLFDLVCSGSMVLPEFWTWALLPRMMDTSVLTIRKIPSGFSLAIGSSPTVIILQENWERFLFCPRKTEMTSSFLTNLLWSNCSTWHMLLFGSLLMQLTSGLARITPVARCLVWLRTWWITLATCSPRYLRGTWSTELHFCLGTISPQRKWSCTKIHASPSMASTGMTLVWKNAWLLSLATRKSNA